MKLLLLLAGLLTLQPLQAQDLPALKDHLQHASTETALDTPSLAPWHLKLDVQLLATPTQKAEQGTIEEWWLNPDTYRIQYAVPSYNAVVLHNGSGRFQTRGQDSPPEILLTLIEQAVHPVDTKGDSDLATAEARRKAFGKAASCSASPSSRTATGGSSRQPKIR